MRIHELAKELGTKSKDLVESLAQMGYEGLTASSSVPDEAVPRLRASGGKAVPAGRPKVVTEEPLPTRRRRKPAVEESSPATEEAPGDGEAVTVEAPAEPAPEEPAAQPEGPGIRVPRGIILKELAERLDAQPTDLIKKMLELGEMVTITQSLSDEAVELLARAYGLEPEIVAPDEDEVEEQEEEEEVDPAKLRPRPPVVTVMGHVDHGKTLLLDAIRHSDVVSGEAGGITQHIGAYQVHQNGSLVTFIDTPGHEAFTAMRARGARVTDIAVLVVAADDGVMPQTVEAIDHARAAGVPILVAVNKIDKEGADPNRVRGELAQQDLNPEDWGGDTVYADVSAKTKDGLDNLLEMIQLVTELEELAANPKASASGTVVESRLDPGRGPVTGLLVQRGTLRIGDAVVAGPVWGKVRAMLNDKGERIEEATPGMPVEVLGFDGVSEAGEHVQVVENERKARSLAQERETRLKAEQLARRAARKVTLQEVFQRASEGQLKEFNIVLKADVSGSLEALEDEIAKLPQEQVPVNVIHAQTGGINESDVMLASASDAVIIGFNVRPVGDARAVAEREAVEIRTYSVIYRVIEELRQAMEGLLKPEQVEATVATVEVRAIFKASRVGTIAGSMVMDGKVSRTAGVRLVRDGTIVWTGKVRSLRRFKDDVAEVEEGMECGIVLDGFADIKEGDVLDVFATPPGA